MKLKWFIAPLVLSIVALMVWTAQRNEAVRLASEINELRDTERSVVVRVAEREKRRREQLMADEMDATNLARIERDRLRGELARRPEVTPSKVNEFKLGEWMPSAAWQDRGTATAKASVETALWAAAGGDVTRLSRMLEIDSRTKQRTEELMATLPLSARANFPTAESLIAAHTVKAIPLGDSQMIWYREQGTEEATVALILKTPPGAAFESAASPQADANQPPSQTENTRTKLTFLSLRRIGAEWRLVVPAVAIDKMAKEMAGSK